MLRKMDVKCPNNKYERICVAGDKGRLIKPLGIPKLESRTFTTSISNKALQQTRTLQSLPRIHNHIYIYIYNVCFVCVYGEIVEGRCAAFDFASHIKSIVHMCRHA